MKLSNIVIVLDHPDESRNIGAACRAMANNDICDLRIVGKKEDYDIEHIHVLGIYHMSSNKEGADFANFQTSNGAKVAVVFGNERTGLTDSQLDECNVGVTIPSSSNFGSLNLSHAVQIMSYHLFRKSLSTKNLIQAGYTPLSLERVDKLVQNITDEMQKIGFFKMPGREDMENFWRSILSRASLSEGEAKYLEKTFSKIAGLSQKNLIK